MNLIFVLINLCFCFRVEHFSMIKDKSDKLHKLTGFSTFYEFFGLTENASLRDIKLAHRKLKKSSPPKELSKEVYNSLVNDGFTILRDMRDEYNDVLNFSMLYFLGESFNYKNHPYLICFSIVAFLILLDLFVYFIRYLLYVENQGKYKKDKKNKKKFNSKIPELFLLTTLYKLRRLF